LCSELGRGICVAMLQSQVGLQRLQPQGIGG
jgi:hypothetical protein